MKYELRRWLAPSEITGFRAWLFHVWCEYEKWHIGIKPDGIRICGFEFERR